MRKWFYALPITVAGLLPLATRAATAVCTPVSGKGLMDGVCDVCYANGQCQIADFFIVGNTITKLILGLSGSVMLLMVIYGGFLWLTSSGNSNMVDKGKKVLIGSIVGLIIVFGAYTATQFLVAALVCTGDASCTTVNEIFARPFQQVKPPGVGTVKPPATTPDTTTPAGSNPTAGTTTPTGGQCVCGGAFNDSAGTAQTMTENGCKNIAAKGWSCTWQQTACVCSGAYQPIKAESSCTADEIKKQLSIPNVDFSATCDWIK